MNHINLLISVNKDFLEHVEELIYSVLYYSSKKIHIYVMYIENELGIQDFEKLEHFIKKCGNAEIIPIKFDAKGLEGMPVTADDGAFFGIEAYSRLFCAFQLPKEVEKILYLDADMICTGDIAELYDLEFDGKTFIACKDVGIKPNVLERLSLPADYKYVNSGMLLINVNKLRNQYTNQDILKMIKNNHKILIYPDQDLLNKMFSNEIKVIDIKYNLLAKTTPYKDLKNKPLIVHFAGSVKPWQNDVSRFDIEYMELYYEVLRLQGNDKKEKLERLQKLHQKYGYRQQKV